MGKNLGDMILLKKIIILYIEIILNKTKKNNEWIGYNLISSLLAQHYDPYNADQIRCSLPARTQIYS